MRYLLFILLLANAFGVDYYVETPYAAADLDDLQYVQMNDVMYLFHPDYAPYKLTRIADNSWTCAKVDWQWGPFLDQNTTTTTITPDGTTGSITLEASSAIFDADHVGSIWEIITKAANTHIEGNLAAAGSSSELAVEGDYLLTLEGSWDGLVRLERSNDNFATSDTIYVKFNPDVVSANIEYSGSEADAGYEYRVTADAGFSGSCDYSLVAYNQDVAGYVEITVVTDSDTATATVQSTLASATATTKWSEGAWSDYRGWPRAVCMYQNRLCAAGTYYQPNGFWTSAAGGDYENMREDDTDAGAINYEVGSAKQNPILWLQDKNGIIAGTSGSIIRIYSGSSTSTMTQTSIASERQGEASSCPIQAVLMGESIIYVDRDRRRVSDLMYDVKSDSYIAPDLTIFAEHITNPGILELAVQERPDPILWAIRSDGVLLSFTYQPTEGVAAWAEHTTDGLFKSVAVIPGTAEDEVWVVVERTINSATVRYVEQFQPQDWGTDPNDCWFVDSGYKYTGVSTNSITGLTWLAGESVQVFKGDSCETVTVSGAGVATLSENVTEATIGMPFTSNLVTFPIEVQADMGFTIGYKKIVHQIVVASYKSMEFSYGEYGDTLYGMQIADDPEIIADTSPYTGLLHKSYEGGWKYETQVHLQQTAPYPLGLTALVTKLEVSEE